MISITHWDADGIYCLYLLYKKFGTEIKVYFSGPRIIEKTLIKVIKENPKDEILFITDIAPTQEAIYLSSYFKKAYWIDHHVWNNLEYTSRIEVFVRNYKSAARVLSEYLNINDENLEIIDDIDSNQIRNSIERDFRDLIVGIRYYYPKTYVTWFIEIAKEIYNGKGINEIVEKNYSIINRFREFLEKVKDKIILKTDIRKIKNKEVIIVDADFNIPSFYIVDILKETLKKDLDYIFILYNNRVEVRTMTNKDVLYIAKKFGGGGHKYAAGFQINSKEDFLKRLEEILR